MSEILSGVIKFLNHSFSKFKTLTQISELNDPEYIDKVLRDAENNFFQDMNYLPSDSDLNKQYNLRIIYNRITAYYEYVVKKPLESNYFDYKDDSDENILKLGELLIGICAKSRKEEYFEVLYELSEQESNEIFKLLGDLIPLEEEKEYNKSKSNDGIEEKKEEKRQYDDDDEEDKANEIAMLWIRAENAEKENERMTHEMDELRDNITELTKSNYTLELNLKETEAKYQELVSSLKKEETESQKKRGNDVNLSIKISELKGKLEAKTKSFYEYQEEKEKLIDELNNKLTTLKKENLALKEIKVEDMSTIKQRLTQCERLIKEKDEEITRLRSSENQDVLLKKIEDLNKQNSLLEEENNQLKEENENIAQQLAVKDCEITQLQENLAQYEPGENDENGDNNVKKEEIKKEEIKEGVSLGNLVEEENKDKIRNEDFIELEKKVAELEKEKNELNDKIKLLEENYQKEKEENEKNKQNNTNLILAENKEKKEQIIKLEKQLNDLEKNKKNLEEKIKEFETILEKDKSNLQKLKEESEKLKQKIRKT